MEVIADICQLSLSDLTDFAIAYVEYEDVGGNFMNDDDLVQDYFGGKNVGYRVIEIIRAQRCEIMAYMPDNVVEMKYACTRGDGVFVYARTANDVNVG
ncbi:hypothetical protein PHABIO_61 [Pseudomonas phage Phabio]|uniref:Uncharacterized protein n=1 Tax=Pseudomonas phage Phabio TaxID=2006668 RepID=A0A1Y0ST95_9CAUD|nr:hypothetical protein MZD05_gp061 [Pseudomonas phage Phabio]ARV76692.1 hypothetical protein PHABIO_61 [Pseudomonas phage Phabio]